VIVLLVWIAAVVVAGVLLAVLAFELRGHARRLDAALGQAHRDLLPRVQRMAARLNGGGSAPEEPDNSTLEGPGRHRADP
jgi:hypothetical protein